jgi:acyl carrier protein
MDNITKKITDILVQIKPDKETTINLKDDLFASGVLDSFGMISYITFLEEAFNIEIPNEELIPQNFWSIEATIQTIERLTK